MALWSSFIFTVQSEKSLCARVKSLIILLIRLASSCIAFRNNGIQLEAILDFWRTDLRSWFLDFIVYSLFRFPCRFFSPIQCVTRSHNSPRKFGLLNFAWNLNHSMAKNALFFCKRIVNIAETDTPFSYFKLLLQPSQPEFPT